MLLVNLLGFFLIALIIWWFWIFKTKEVNVSENGIVIKVNNGTYEPSRIKLTAGKPTELHFLRSDESPCSATVLIPDLEISLELPLEKMTSITLPDMAKGEYPFHCQMKMYKGTLLVE
ncbi:MAG: plastocyanin [Gammaproteobacteria bacterium]|nr:MAG: plastocyanin [Gammaproteobacteria bacterium]